MMEGIISTTDSKPIFVSFPTTYTKSFYSISFQPHPLACCRPQLHKCYIKLSSCQIPLIPPVLLSFSSRTIPQYLRNFYRKLVPNPSQLPAALTECCTMLMTHLAGLVLMTHKLYRVLGIPSYIPFLMDNDRVYVKEYAMPQYETPSRHAMRLRAKPGYGCANHTWLKQRAAWQ